MKTAGAAASRRCVHVLVIPRPPCRKLGEIPERDEVVIKQKSGKHANTKMLTQVLGATSAPLHYEYIFSSFSVFV